MEKEKTINNNRWVSYFDILGFKELMKNFIPLHVLNILKQAINAGNEYNIKCKFIFFSDSFCFYTENDSPEAFSCIEATSSMFFRSMFIGKEKFPMRGCMDIGQFYIDEENKIYFGLALAEAIKLAENQNWIGFILSKKVEDKLASIESANIKSGYKYRYDKYKVPFKKPVKQPDMLLTYNLGLLPSNTEKNEIYNIWKGLDYMRYVAEGNQTTDNKKPSERQDIMAKYENTKIFMFWKYPWLKEIIENQKQIKQ